MSILSLLASASGRKDKALNIQLAELIVAQSDESAIAELIEKLQHKNIAIFSNCIKVLHEISGQKANLIASYTDNFIQLLKDKNYCLIWGDMTALDRIADIQP